MKFAFKFLSALIFALAIVACSGGGDSAKTYSTSIFIDSPVGGLYYRGEPSGTVGNTASDGTFKYVAGDTVTFKIGGASGLSLGSSSPADGLPVVVTDLPGGDQVAQILQTFSTSANPGAMLDLSKIQLSPTQVGILKAHIDNRGDLDDFKNGALTTIAQTISTNIGVTLTPKSTSDVQAHLLTSLANVTAAPRFNDQLYLLVKNVDHKPPQAFLKFNSADKTYRIFDNNFRKISGSFTQGTDNLTLNFENFQERIGNSYSNQSASVAGCKVTISQISNLSTTDTGPVAIQGFKGNPTGKTSCADATKNDSGGTPIMAVAIDTTFSLANLDGKTLQTFVPNVNGTGCSKRVTFAFATVSDHSLGVTANVDATESDQCKDLFDSIKFDLTFSQARPEGDTNYAQGLFTFNFREKLVNGQNGNKYVTIFMARPRYLNKPEHDDQSNVANTVIVMLYADNVGVNGMEMKSTSGAPANLISTTPLNPSSPVTLSN